MSTEHDERGHERSDLDVRRVFLLGGALAAFALVAQVALWFHMTGMWHARQRALPPASPVARELPEQPPEPRLQTSPQEDLRAMRAEEETLLHGYGWVDRGAGVVRIPIERAMELVVQEARR